MVTIKEILNNEKENSFIAYKTKKLFGLEERSFDEWWEGEADEGEIASFLKSAPRIIKGYQEDLNNMLALLAKIRKEYPELYKKHEEHPAEEADNEV